MKDGVKGLLSALTMMALMLLFQAIMDPTSTAETIGAFFHHVYEGFEKGFTGSSTK